MSTRRVDGERRRTAAGDSRHGPERRRIDTKGFYHMEKTKREKGQLWLGRAMLATFGIFIAVAALGDLVAGIPATPLARGFAAGIITFGLGIAAVAACEWVWRRF